MSNPADLIEILKANKRKKPGIHDCVEFTCSQFVTSFLFHPKLVHGEERKQGCNTAKPFTLGENGKATVFFFYS